jgi:hypothetical protein
VRDPNFIYLQHGQLHIGDFNTTVKSTGSPPGLEWQYQLQVEGEGYIRTLSHGYPHKKRGLETLVESVEDEPKLITSTASHTLSVRNLSLLPDHSEREGLKAGAFFEVSISGAALGPPDCTSVCVIATKFMLVPLARPGAEPELHAKSLVAGDDDNVAVELLDGQRVWRGSEVLFVLPRATERELVVEVRRSGRPCAVPVVSLV